MEFKYEEYLNLLKLIESSVDIILYSEVKNYFYPVPFKFKSKFFKIYIKNTGAKYKITLYFKGLPILYRQYDSLAKLFDNLYNQIKRNYTRTQCN